MNREKKLIELLQSGSLRGIIFDFDGTLLDIREILEKAIEEILVEKNVNVDMETTIQEIGALLETIQGFPLPKVLLESYDIFKHITSLSNLSYFNQLRIAVKIFSKYLEYSKRNQLANLINPKQYNGKPREINENELITRKELELILKNSNLKLRTLIMVMYEGALRRGEVLGIKYKLEPKFEECLLYSQEKCVGNIIFNLEDKRSLI